VVLFADAPTYGDRSLLAYHQALRTAPVACYQKDKRWNHPGIRDAVRWITGQPIKSVPNSGESGAIAFKGYPRGR